jgi:hypothetical protein
LGYEKRCGTADVGCPKPRPPAVPKTPPRRLTAPTPYPTHGSPFSQRGQTQQKRYWCRWYLRGTADGGCPKPRPPLAAPKTPPRRLTAPAPCPTHGNPFSQRGQTQLERYWCRWHLRGAADGGRPKPRSPPAAPKTPPRKLTAPTQCITHGSPFSQRGQTQQKRYWCRWHLRGTANGGCPKPRPPAVPKTPPRRLTAPTPCITHGSPFSQRGQTQPERYWCRWHLRGTADGAALNHDRPPRPKPLPRRLTAPIPCPAHGSPFSQRGQTQPERY